MSSRLAAENETKQIKYNSNWFEKRTTIIIEDFSRPPNEEPS